MIILRTPKGWTGPKEVNDKIIEGSFRAHQVPLAVNKDNEEIYYRQADRRRLESHG